MTRNHCLPDELSSLELFHRLHAAQLKPLCANERVEVMPAGRTSGAG